MNATAHIEWQLPFSLTLYSLFTCSMLTLTRDIVTGGIINDNAYVRFREEQPDKRPPQNKSSRYPK